MQPAHPCQQETLLETVPTYQTVSGHLHFTTAPIVPQNLQIAAILLELLILL